MIRWARGRKDRIIRSANEALSMDPTVLHSISARGELPRRVSTNRRCFLDQRRRNRSTPTSLTEIRPSFTSTTAASGKTAVLCHLFRHDDGHHLMLEHGADIRYISKAMLGHAKAHHNGNLHPGLHRKLRQIHGTDSTLPTTTRRTRPDDLKATGDDRRRRRAKSKRPPPAPSRWDFKLLL